MIINEIYVDVLDEIVDIDNDVKVVNRRHITIYNASVMTYISCGYHNLRFKFIMDVHGRFIQNSCVILIYEGYFCK